VAAVGSVLALVALLGPLTLAQAMEGDPPAGPRPFAENREGEAREQARNGGNGENDDEDDDRPKLTADSDGVTYRDPRLQLKLQLGGRLHVDVGGGEARGRDLDEASLWRGRLRRGRIEFYAGFRDHWHGFVQLEPFDRAEPWQDVRFGYSGFDRLSLTLGNMEEPFGLENLESSNDTVFMERALPTALIPGRRIGAVAAWAGERWSLVGGVFGRNINIGSDRIGTAVTARATLAPVKEDEQVLHLGLSASHRRYGLGRAFGISPEPESRVYDVALIGFDAIEDVRSVSRLGFEAGYMRGPFRIQGEYVAARLDRDLPFGRWREALQNGNGNGNGNGNNGNGHGNGKSIRPKSDPVLFGGYLQLSYVLTGQPYTYHVAPDPRFGTNYGIFDGIDLKSGDAVGRGGIGAWEVAARISFLDLDAPGLDGGRQRNLSVGLNWYPEKNVRLMLNYTRAQARAPDDDDRPVRRAADIVQGRLQVAF
jgi:phosphate-selective porin OprO and OprP